VNEDSKSPDEEPTPRELMMAVHDQLVEAIQDYARTRGVLTGDDPDGALVVANWMIVFDCAHSDSTRSFGIEMSDSMQDWQTIGMLEYAKSQIYGTSAVDAIVEFGIIPQVEDEDDDDDDA